MGESVKYPAPTPTLKDAADQVEVRKAFSDLSRVLEKKIVGEKTGSDTARGLYVENTEGPNAQEIAAPGTIPIRDDNGALPGNITGDAHTVDGAHASVTPSAGEIPILDGAGAAAIDITGNAPTATLAADSTLFGGKSPANFVLDYIYPVGCYYTQYPDASSNTDATEFPTAQRPATLFGGTWVAQWDTESIYFRTNGTLSDTDRTNGKQEDAFQGFKITKSGSSYNPVNGNWSDNYVVQVTTPNTAGQTANFGNIVADATHGTPRISSETRAVNRRIKVWKRTA